MVKPYSIDTILMLKPIKQEYLFATIERSWLVIHASIDRGVDSSINNGRFDSVQRPLSSIFFIHYRDLISGW